MVNISINGFGRIGRLFFRKAFKSDAINLVAINDLGSTEELGYLLQYDTVYGEFEHDVQASGDSITVGEKKIPFFEIENPSELPWEELGVDIAVEATGVFTEYEKARAHLEAGADRVVITAPGEGEEGVQGKTVLMGVNEGEIEKTLLTSNASCTTNAASPVISIMKNNLGIEKAMLSTIHGYTASQNLVDGLPQGSKIRRSRAAAENIIPSSTGSAKAVGKAIEEMKSKFDGIAFRVPVPAGSVADITFLASQDTSVEEVNKILRQADEKPEWEGVYTYSEDPIVSSDIVGEPYGAIADLSYTRVVDSNLVKVLSWYDNEYGYVSTLVKHVKKAAELL
ncbi:MAG: type I glyceraldehyde-3-phosphate dehydrogenase [Candidatus Magasanikbacteria bacterium]